jgi:hypothetical protein
MRLFGNVNNKRVKFAFHAEMDRQRLPFRSHLMNLLYNCAFLFLLRTRVSPSISQLHSSNSHLLYFSFTTVHLRIIHIGFGLQHHLRQPFTAAALVASVSPPLEPPIR